MADTKKEKQEVFNRLWDEGNWPELRAFLFECLKDEPDSHWIPAQIAETYYQEKSFDKALEYAEKAWEIAPRCPLVLWEYAESLLRVGRNSEAEPLYRSIIRRGVKRIAYGQCGEGLPSARTLVNDCRYALGFILAGRGEFSAAEKYIKQHIANRNYNCTSLFRLREVKRDLAKILEGKAPQFDEPL